MDGNMQKTGVHSLTTTQSRQLSICSPLVFTRLTSLLKRKLWWEMVIWRVFMSGWWPRRPRGDDELMRSSAIG